MDRGQGSDSGVQKIPKKYISHVTSEGTKVVTWSESSSEGGSAGGQKAVLREPCFTSVGLGVGG